MMKRKRFKVIASVILGLITVFAVGALTGCGGGAQRSKVSVMMENSVGDKWIFTPGIQELSVEYEYTGTPIRFYINKLCVLNSERAEPDWIWVDQIQDYEFYRNVSYTPLNGVESNAKSGAVCERGEYLIRYDFHGPEFYYDRTFVLRVTIK